MKTLLFGKDGQIGWELKRALAPLGPLVALGHHEADFLRPRELAELVATHRPDVVVNAAAYTAVDRAESEANTARQINTEAVAVLAEASRRQGCWLVTYSTDYVFDGRKDAPYLENDVTNPLNVYGRSKRDGEEAIRASGCKHLILRTSWVYGRHGNNFLKTMLRLAAEHSELRIVADQIGAPTGGDFVADVTALALHQLARGPDAGALSGTCNLTATGETSWHGYAVFLLAEARRRGAPLSVSPDGIVPVPSADYATPAMRPANSRLSTEKLATTFGVTPPHWQTGVSRLIAELVAEPQP
ncbi:MAG TPA: dTDP-4-dehydrorhamnose reductase [Arsenicitalea sp.]|jgi:dTDP-4-dehydrorhamnose reductase|nr:dTDP-4-dehydrorhamnose reductase [Arsenicitalea sp.]